MNELQMSSYARQYCVLGVETRDHVTANYQTHDGHAKDDANNVTGYNLVKKVVGRFEDQIINSYDTIYISIGFNAFKNAFILCLCSLVMKSPHTGRAYKIRAIIRE